MSKFIPQRSVVNEMNKQNILKDNMKKDSLTKEEQTPQAPRRMNRAERRARGIR